MLGVLIAALISTLIPDDLLVNFLGTGWMSLVAMLLVGIPLYICASASTPIAAALVLKGLSPGAALVFLLAGPATNAATITVVARYWGRQATLVYLFSIATCSLGLGWFTNQLYGWLAIDISQWVHTAGADQDSWWGGLSAILLLALILRSFVARPPGECNNACG